MMKQKDAVYAAINNTFEFSGDGRVTLDKDQRSSVVDILCEGFAGGKIGYDGEVPTGPKLRTYCNGLLTNWLNKDVRLNGGTKYTAKNPGSRAGSGDAQVRALRALMSTKTDESERSEIQSFIDRRLAEISPSKSVQVNIADLPEELRAKYGV